MFRVIKLSLLSIMVLIQLSSTYAQRPQGVGSGGSSGGGFDPNKPPETTLEEGPDSTTYDYIFIHNPFKSYVNVDTSLDISFLQDDPINTKGDEHVHTGNKGSASFPLIFQPKVYTTWAAGYHNYDIYRKSIDQFKFTIGNRPLADLYFSQLANQQNLNVGAKFTNNFKSGLTIALEYDRISQLGFLKSQPTKSTGLIVALRYYQPKSRLQSFLVFARNANDESHNGGLSNYNDLVTGDIQAIIPTKLNNATSRYQDQTISTVNYMRLNPNPKSVWNLYLKDDLSYTTNYAKYADKITSTPTDSIFYGTLLIDNRGLRTYLGWNQLHNGFYINGERKKGVQGRLGLDVDIFWIDNDSGSSNRTDLTVRFEGKVPIMKRLIIDTKAALGVGENVGNFDTQGTIDIRLGKIAILNSGVRFFNSEASQLQEQLEINTQPVRTTELKNYFGSTLFASLNLPSLGLKIGLKQHVVNNAIYWDQKTEPQQLNDIFAHTYANASYSGRLWRFYSDNQVHAQVQSQAIYPVPRLYSTHQFYYGCYLFKRAMQLKVGVDMRWVENHKGTDLQPLVHVFNLSDDDIPTYTSYRAFVMTKVARFRIYVSFENLDRYWNGNFYSQAVANHPLYDTKFRMSIRWIIKD